jgi:hypothetical protein
MGGSECFAMLGTAWEIGDPLFCSDKETWSRRHDRIT